MAEKPRTYSETVVPWLDDDKYRKEFQARRVMDLLSPKLIFDPMYGKTNTPGKSLSLPVQSVGGTRYSDSTDPRQRFAPEFVHGARIPKVSYSSDQYKAYTLPRRTLAFDVPLNVYSELDGANLVRTARRRLARGLADQINADIVASVLNSWSMTNTDTAAMYDIMTHIATDFGPETTIGHLVGILDAANFWDAAGANPVTDILDLSTVIGNQSGYPFEGTDVIMKRTEMNLFHKFVISHGGTWARDPTKTGWQSDACGDITFRAVKNDTAGFDTTAGDGYIWMYDRNNPAATTYYFTDKKYPTVGGFMNYHQWYSDEKKLETFQMWHARRTIVHEPLAMAVLQVRD